MCLKHNVNHGKYNGMSKVHRAETLCSHGRVYTSQKPMRTHHFGPSVLVNHKHTERIQYKKTQSFIYTYQTNLQSLPKCLPLCNKNTLGSA